MDADAIDRTLDLLVPDEIRDVLSLVDICERKGTMRRTAADEWRRRIRARQRFLELDETTTDDG